MQQTPGFSWQRFFDRPTANRVFIAGIVNATPDSFSDGNGSLDSAAKVKWALQLLDEGADLLDVGGESTRPGALEVAPEEEWRRLEPVLTGILSARPDTIISVDTRHAVTAEKALQAGVKIINDVSGLQFDPAMAGVIAAYSAGAILTHSSNIPELMQQQSSVIDHHPSEVVAAGLQKIVKHALTCAIKPEQIMLDVGIGFGKSRAANYELLRQAQWFERSFELPFCWGVSRKSLLKSDPDTLEKRIAGSLALAVKLSEQQVSLLRVHDVAATAAALAAARELDS